MNGLRRRGFRPVRIFSRLPGTLLLALALAALILVAPAHAQEGPLPVSDEGAHSWLSWILDKLDYIWRSLWDAIADVGHMLANRLVSGFASIRIELFKYWSEAQLFFMNLPRFAFWSAFAAAMSATGWVADQCLTYFPAAPNLPTPDNSEILKWMATVFPFATLFEFLTAAAAVFSAWLTLGAVLRLVKIAR